jgi:mono/diheme cytochrome c family protein
MNKPMIKLLPVLAVAIALGSCDRPGKDNPGNIYMPDMTYSNAYETYSASEVKTGEGVDMSARLPVAGTIPFGYIPQDDKIKTDQSKLMSYMIKNHFSHATADQPAERDRAGLMISDPLEASAENLAEGKRLYEINCKVCHGEKGEGNGQIIELPNGDAGPYTARPNPYKTLLPPMKDGAIFYSVSYGRNSMGGYGFQLSVKERWQVIHYIKSLAGITPGAQPVAAEATTETAKK